MARFTVRGGKAVRTDEAFEAWTSGDLGRMFRALSVKTNPIDRHFLLLGIVNQTYKLRSDPTMAAECVRVSELHLAEFPELGPALKRELRGIMPKVPTFQNYAALLAERGDFERAIEVCELAISYGLHDGTSSGFEGRIARFQKSRDKKSRA